VDCVDKRFVVDTGK